MPSTRRTLLYGLALVGLVLAAGVVSATVAERRALAAETAYVEGHLESADCLSDWGTNEGAGPSRDARITRVSSDGVYVRVTLPYAYTVGTGDDRVFADTASEAVYRVTPTDAHRVSGDDVTVC
ncbi:hypothetical protein [Haloarcula pellucida]|uniref:Uncharacterized protein n=1 Tax=Haloarcula pellucida TaxID=1427151 RepID=A0A830GJA2_9EURY|nr:hypothetical protein [Halomicroarcula pellucida]MBX0347026.1 hypothetical protein [Halomicroarcula pellucida]GGN86609.1 hypothetical protein GCM10009030_04480 [Halomicroarcula pellucida]